MHKDIIMLAQYILIALFAHMTHSLPPQINLQLVHGSALRIQCTVDDNPSGLIKIYRMPETLESILSVSYTVHSCHLKTLLRNGTVFCNCENRNSVVCSISDGSIIDVNDEWTCASFKHNYPVYSDRAKVSLQGINESITTSVMGVLSSSTPSIAFNASEELHVTSDIPSFSYGTSEGTSVSFLDAISNETTTPHTSGKVLSTTTLISSVNDNVHPMLLIIVSASGIVVILLAVTLLLYVYRKCHMHTATRLELPQCGTISSPHFDRFRNSVVSLEISSEVHRPAVENNERNPIMTISPLAELFPLSQQNETVWNDVIEQQNEQVATGSHYYEIIPDIPNSEASASFDGREDSVQIIAETVRYECLLQKTGDSPYTMLSSS